MKGQVAGQAGSWRALLAGTNGIRMLVLCTGVALHAINLYVAATIMPSVVREIGGLAWYAWTTSLFVLGSILGSAFAAQLMRRAGTRPSYLAGAALFAAGCLMCASASTMALLIVGRFVQGLGGGLLLALPYAMIQILFDRALWPRSSALVSGMWGFATLTGPAFGGALAEIGMWRHAFGSLAVLAAVLAVIAAVVLPMRTDTRSAAPFPAAQLALLAAMVLAASASAVAPSAAGQLLLLAAAAVLLWWLLRREKYANARLLPRAALQNSPLRPLYLTMALLAVTVTCSEVYVPWFLQELHGLGPLAAGLMAATMSAGWTAGSITVSSASGSRVAFALRSSPWLSAAGIAATALLLPAGGGGAFSLVLLVGAMMTVGLAVGISWPHLASFVMHQAPRAEADLAAASITTVQLTGTALSAALAGLVVNLAGIADPANAARAAGWLFALTALAPACLLLTRNGAAAAALPRNR